MPGRRKVLRDKEPVKGPLTDGGSEKTLLNVVQLASEQLPSGIHSHWFVVKLSGTSVCFGKAPFTSGRGFSTEKSPALLSNSVRAKPV